ncbi:MAG: glycosyltransferase family 4 protein [Actinobacteria bacterium]|nr:glycosyltransferase family 4 protein [Actinomycetota bacterium]
MTAEAGVPSARCGDWSARLGRRPRVAFLAWRDLAHPQAGGSEFVVDRLAAGLVERGYDVTVLAGSPTMRHEYPVWPLGGTYDQYLRAPFVYRKRVRTADIVIDVENGVPYWAPLWQRAPVVCLVHHVHTEQWAMQFPAPIAAAGRLLESRVMPRVYRRSEYVAVSRSTAAALEGIGVPAGSIATIEMGAAPLAPLGERSPDPRFLVLGRLVPHKRVDLALRHWPPVRARTGGTLVIAGDGPELERLRALGGEGVEFTGYVTEERKAQELGAAWVLVHPAHHEGWGTVVMEAAAAGVPTVGFDVEGVRDSVDPGVTGVLAADEAAFAEAWATIGTDHALRTRMSDAARARAATFTWPRALDEMEVVIDRVLARAKGVGR